MSWDHLLPDKHLFRITIVADTHGCHDDLRLTSGDLLIHCGDFSAKPNGPKPNSYKVSQFTDWFKWQNYKTKVLVPGNHDENNEPLIKLAREGVAVLIDRAIEVEGFVIYGSPWTPRHRPGPPRSASAFRYDPKTDFARQTWAQIHDETDILVTHTPAFGVLDRTDDGRHIGCKELLYRRLQLKELKLVCHGHVHEAGGYEGHFQNGSHVLTVNAARAPKEQRSYGWTAQSVYNINLERK